MTRATRGACVIADRRARSATASGPIADDGEQDEDDLREGEQDVVAAHEHVVEPVARVGGDEPDATADDDAEERRGGPPSRARCGRRSRKRLKTSRPSASAPNERVARTGSAFGDADELGRRVRREQRPEHRDQRPCRPTIAEPDLRPRQPQASRRMPSHRPAAGARGGDDGSIPPRAESTRSSIGLVGHRTAVLSCGVTRIVARSATRLSTT